jgi:hypothetical protein
LAFDHDLQKALADRSEGDIGGSIFPRKRRPEKI